MLAEVLSAWFQSARDQPVIGAWLFGSQASGRSHRQSDVDIAVLLDRAVVPDRRAREDVQLRLIGELIAALHRNDVDLVVLNDVPPLLARSILRDGLLLFSADAEVVRAYDRDVQLRAADVAPFIERHRRTLLETLRTDPPTKR